MVLHPLFDAFIRMKWNKCCLPYYIFCIYNLIYTFLIICNSLEQFSFLNGHVHPKLFFWKLTVMLPFICFERTINVLLNFMVIIEFMRKYNYSIICYGGAFLKALISIIWNFSLPTLLGVILFYDFDKDSNLKRELSCVLIFLSAILNLTILAEIPSFGIHLMMIKRVMFSAGRFFMTFGILFCSFGLVFHILLPHAESFSNLADSYIKVFAMMMGELDVYNSFTKNEEAGVLAKIFFLIFLIFMALVFMNLLLGIAVSDIHELERISQTQSVVIRCFSIEYIEQIYMIMR